MTAVITLTLAGADTGPFNLYSNVDGYISAFANNITRAQLLAGYATDALPNFTTIVKIKSVGECLNSVEVVVPPQTCYNFLPTDSYYLLDYIIKPTTSYFYGFFDGYVENDIPTLYKNLVKLNLDLTLDTSFDVGVGFDEILYTGCSILEQPDGKIIVTGTFLTYQGVTKNRIVRLNTDASIDATFITGTGFDGFTQSPAIDSNDSVIITGLFSDYNGTPAFRIARLLSNGTIDPTFITGTGFNNTTTDVLVNPDNSMFILGYFDTYNGVAVSPGIIKLMEDGSVDPSFNAGTGIDPYLPNNANYFARIAGETSFYVGGYLTDYNGTTISQIIKLNIDGTVDTSFNSGTGFDGINLYSMNVIWGDKLLIEGDFLNYNGTPSNYSIILNSDGTVYYTFDLVYRGPVVIGNNLFAAEDNDCLKLLHTFVPDVTPPTIINGGALYQANPVDPCDPLMYPYTVEIPFPTPYSFGLMFSPYKIWSDIEYIEVMSVTLVAGLEIKYNGITVTPGDLLYPISADVWVNTMETIRSTFDCDLISEVWTVRIKLYDSPISNVANYTIYFNQQSCPDCLTTTSTTTTI